MKETKPIAKQRCPWCEGDALYEKYHDDEWGRPCHNDQVLFEFLILESAQAGLSWLTILKKRLGYKKAFANFDPKKVAKFDDQKIESLMSDSGIIRNRLKIKAAVNNAKLFLEVQKEFGSFSRYAWSWVQNESIVSSWKSLKQIPTTTKESNALARDLKRRGFKFLGPTTVYAFMQAMGLVNDHIESCYLSPKKKKQ